MDALEIPAFLRGSRPGPKPRWKTPWRMPKRQRPEGKKWEEAALWEVYVDHGNVPQMKGDGRPRVGTRCVWVITGDQKWTEIRDAEGYYRMPTANWLRMSKKGKIISAS